MNRPSFLEFIKNLNPPTTRQEFLNILTCTKNNEEEEEDWSKNFDEKYPQAWSQKNNTVSQLGVISVAGIPTNNVRPQQQPPHQGDIEQHSNVHEIEQLNDDVDEPYNIDQHLDQKAFVDQNNNIFLGIYDGNGKASLHLKDLLFVELSSLVRQNDNQMCEDIIRRAFSSVENKFMQYVQNNQNCINDGSCCIASIIWGRMLYITNLGDSRAVLGSKWGVSIFKKLNIEQLTNDHSLSNENIREDVKALNPHDSEVVQIDSEGIWKSKGNIKVTRSIGYARLKVPLIPETELRNYTLVSAKPELYSRKIRKGDRFLILGSQGFWNFMTNRSAANIVNHNPQDEIAKRLLSAALEKATAEKRGGTEAVYDDMIIIILFFSDELSKREDTPKTVVLHEGPSYFLLSNSVGSSIGRESDIHQSGQSDLMDTIKRAMPLVFDNFMKGSTLRSNDGEGSSSSSHQQLPPKDTSEMDQLMATSTKLDNIEIKIAQKEQEQESLQHQQPLPPVSATYHALELIGKTLAVTEGMLTLKREKNIFGYVDDHLFDYIYGSLMTEVAKQEELSISSMTFYVWYLHDEIIQPQELFNKFSFLNPHVISNLVQKEYEETDLKAHNAIATIFLESQKSKDKLILAPCNTGSHWVLIVINVNADTVHYLDSLNSNTENYKNMIPNFQKIFDRYYRDSGVNPKSTEVHWNCPKCPKQPNNKDCGYYVMKFMKEIIKTSPNEISENYKPEIKGKTYSEDDLNEVKTDWASYLINYINTAYSDLPVSSR